jgi:hypothetical protein
MKDHRIVHVVLFIALLLSLSCSLPFALSTQPAPLPPPAPGYTIAPPPALGNPIPAAAGSATPPALLATIMASQHMATPANVGASGKLNYDVDSSSTGPEHRAPYGDSYNINLFERPFTQTDMNYLPQLDIATFQLHEDANWYYVSFDLVGGDMNDPSAINYGVELDTDHDGFGDVLIWAFPPYTPEWLAETVQVYRDTNHDTGGASAEKSDAVYPGNGYDSLIFDRGQGSDTDLAWVRANPQVSAAVQFAFKRSLAGNAFMWGVWADSGLRDPAQFNYNDRFTEEQAGSPEKSEKHYPIESIYQVDNTCWTVVGFKPTGYEPHLCPSLEPRPTRQKAAPTAPAQTCVGLSCYGPLLDLHFEYVPHPEPLVCLPPGTLIDTPRGPTPVESLRPGDGAWSADETGARFRATITRVSRQAVPPGHPLVHVFLADGREVWASPGHPTADGRTFGDLRAGEMLDGALVSSAEMLSSEQTATYDLLPSGTTGFYWANGVLIGSTLAN